MQTAARRQANQRTGWLATVFGPREWLDGLGSGDARLLAWPVALLWIAAAGASVGALADRWVPWHMAVWAAGAAVGAVAGLATLHCALLRPLGGTAWLTQLVGVWGLAGAPAGVLLPLNLWAALHPPQDAFALSGFALLSDLLTKLAVVYGLGLGALATVAVNGFQVREDSESSRGSWWEPRDLLLALTAPRRLFDALRAERGPMLTTPHLGSALLVMVAAGVGDAYVRGKGLWSPLPSLYLVTRAKDFPMLAPGSGWVLAGLQVGATALAVGGVGLALRWVGRALRGSATLGQGDGKGTPLSRAGRGGVGRGTVLSGCLKIES